MPSARDSTAMLVNSLLPAMLRKAYRMSCANGSQKFAVLIWRLPPWGSIYFRRRGVIVVGAFCSIRCARLTKKSSQAEACATKLKVTIASVRMLTHGGSGGYWETSGHLARTTCIAPSPAAVRSGLKPSFVRCLGDLFDAPGQVVEKSSHRLKPVPPSLPGFGKTPPETAPCGRGSLSALPAIAYRAAIFSNPKTAKTSAEAAAAD